MESLAFVLWASLLGVTIVFAFLALLAALMLLIRAVDRIGRGAESGARGAVAGTPAALPVWAVAAVAAYLAEERTIDRGSAGAWVRRPNR
jgi:Na+-transporting methylmalonyl-CoA/oxaloacetate decarboxylase gamma subunit